MKLTPSKLRQIIRAEARTALRESAEPHKRSLASLIFEDANPAKIDLDRFPIALSKAAADPEMKDKTTKGQEDKDKVDDVVAVKDTSWPVNKLKPSQSTMKVSNAVGMAMGMLVSGKPGGNLGAFVSSDGYIMDGHHRWIATYMVDPGASVSGKEVALPGEQLVAILNAITAGRLGNKGNPGKGSFADFQNKDKILEEINKVIEKGVPKMEGDKQVGYFTTPEDAKKAVDDKGGADKLADMFVKNLSSATLSTPSWAVERVEMPVINPGANASETEKALKGGEVDLNPPYYEGGKGGEEKEKQTAGYVRSGRVVMERWQKIAGLIK